MNLNRLIISIFLIIFSLQSLTKADDIRDFQIEGMSIGDSLLSFVSEDQIKNNKKDWFRNTKYSISAYRNLSNFYDEIQITFKTNDKNKNIEGIEALKDFPKNIKGCLNELQNVRNIVFDLFEDDNIIEHKIKTHKHTNPKSNNSYITDVMFDFESDDRILIACYEDKDEKYIDGLRLSARTKEYEYFLNYEAYR